MHTLKDIHVKIRMDNITAVACIQRYDSIKPKLLGLTRDIFEWAQERNIIISASYIPGVCNSEADEESRKLDSNTEWMLDRVVFKNYVKSLGNQRLICLHQE